MSRWVHSFGIFTILSIGTAFPCFGQSTAAPTAAATPSTSDNATNATSKPGDGAPTAKKVWTNDDLGTASRSAVKASGKQSQQYTMTKPADPATVAKVRDNLQRLQKQLDDTDKQLASFKQFQDGDSSVDGGGRAFNKGYSRTPPDQQIAALQEKRKKLQGQIDDLLDDARKKGIESAQLR
jgi:hypothetical protein